MRIASLKINTLEPSTQPRWKENHCNYITKPQTQTKRATKITYIIAYNPAYRVAKKHKSNQKINRIHNKQQQTKNTKTTKIQDMMKSRLMGKATVFVDV